MLGNQHHHGCDIYDFHLAWRVSQCPVVLVFASSFFQWC
jgi:hypothetical protein